MLMLPSSFSSNALKFEVKLNIFFIYFPFFATLALAGALAFIAGLGVGAGLVACSYSFGKFTLIN